MTVYARSANGSFKRNVNGSRNFWGFLISSLVVSVDGAFEIYQTKGKSIRSMVSRTYQDNYTGDPSLDPPKGAGHSYDSSGNTYVVTYQRRQGDDPLHVPAWADYSYVYLYSGATSTLLASRDITSDFRGGYYNRGYAYGCSWDGTNLVVAGNVRKGVLGGNWYEARFVKYNAMLSSKLDEFDVLVTAESYGGDVCWDGQDALWVNNSAGETHVYLQDGFSSTVKDSIALPNQPVGVAWDGADLYTKEGTFRKYDGWSASLLDTGPVLASTVMSIDIPDASQRLSAPAVP